MKIVGAQEMASKTPGKNRIPESAVQRRTGRVLRFPSLPAHRETNRRRGRAVLREVGKLLEHRWGESMRPCAQLTSRPRVHFMPHSTTAWASGPLPDLPEYTRPQLVVTSECLIHSRYVNAEGQSRIKVGAHTVSPIVKSASASWGDGQGRYGRSMRIPSSADFMPCGATAKRLGIQTV